MIPFVQTVHLIRRPFVSTVLASLAAFVALLARRQIAAARY